MGWDLLFYQPAFVQTTLSLSWASLSPQVCFWREWVLLRCPLRLHSGLGRRSVWASGVSALGGEMALALWVCLWLSFCRWARASGSPQVVTWCSEPSRPQAQHPPPPCQSILTWQCFPMVLSPCSAPPLPGSLSTHLNSEADFFVIAVV